MALKRRATFWVFTAAMIGSGLGCELLATVDRSKIPDGITSGAGGMGGSMSSSSSTTTSGMAGAGGVAGMGGMGGAGGTACMSETDCPDPGTVCVLRTCINNQCGTDFAAQGTQLPNQSPNDCTLIVCDGAGSSEVVADDLDLPVDGNPCTDDVCTAGVGSNPPVASGTACGMNLICDGNGLCVGCVTANDCPGVDNDCQARSCTAGVCGFDYTAAGTPIAMQAVGDCQVVQCNGTGGTQSAADNADVPADGKQCTGDVCTAGAPSNPNLPINTACTENNGTLCNGGGACVQCNAATDCPGQDTECQVRACNAGLCGVSNTPAGTPVASQTAGDCKVNQCDGAGAIETVAQNGDLPDDTNPCTNDTCVGGAPTYTPVGVGTACGPNLICDGNGVCTGCVTANDCPGQDTECQARACNAGTCGFTYTAAGTQVASQTAGDCKVNQCDGSGAIVSVAQDADLPNDGQQCTQDVCTNGTPSFPALASGTVCSQNGGTLCNGTGACVQCLVAATCPGTDDECQTRTCVAGTCGVNFTAAGTPVASQIAGDCQVNQCNGSGVVVSAPSNGDVPVDGIECTNDVCTAGVPSNPNTNAGTACSQNGGTVCSGVGTCVACVVGSNCPGQDTECQTRSCSSFTCGFNFTAAGTSVASQTAGDCQVSQCDGAGAIVNNIDNSDVPVDANACTDNVCTAGVPSNPNTSAGTSCGPGLSCDGNGACVGCVTGNDCPGVDNACQTRTCVMGSCGMSYMPAGTVVAGQITGDCHVNQCDGAGTVVNNIDNTDIPADAIDCTDDLCTAGVPSNPFSPLGALCNQSGGIVCTGAGLCVQCNNDFDCTGGAYCSSNMCVMPTCSDALKNGTETDVDCGGGTCAPCNPGQACAVNADCETNVCTALTCQSPSVVSTNPADGAANVSPATSIAITFTSAMNAGTLSAQTLPGPCTGTIQVSADNFVTCIGFTAGAPSMSGGNTIATLIPSDALWFASTYKIHVAATVQDSFGNALGAAFTQATGFTTLAACTGQKTVVISEVYGAGGNAGPPPAVYTNDFIELHNRGNKPVDLTGWSVQYTSATGVTWTNKTNLSGTIAPGGHLLVQQAGGANGVALPTPDITGTIAMAAAAGKVALVNSTTLLTGGCPLADPTVVDFVGYGVTANCFEGTGPAPAPSTVLSVQRANSACSDTANNASDFAAAAPAPQNGPSAPNVCPCSLSDLNETNTPNEVDYCNIQAPASFAVQTGQPTQVIYGRAYELGVTEAAGPNPAISSQVGWGPAGSDPRLGMGWYFVPASYNVQVGNDDEYQASFIAPPPGNYAYAVRFNLNGAGFTYCDLDGAGSNAGLDFSPAQLGAMTVNP